MRKHVLLIDDDADDIELFKEALFEADPESTFHYYDDAALLINRMDHLKNNKPDIIFLDINMTSISGWDCLNMLREYNLLTSIPVIMYSTSSHKKEVEQALNEGAWGFVTKPSNYKQLIQLLQKILYTPETKLREILSVI